MLTNKDLNEIADSLQVGWSQGLQGGKLIKKYALVYNDNVQMFYRDVLYTRKDGDSFLSLQYRSYANLWQGSLSDDLNAARKKLVEII